MPRLDDISLGAVPDDQNAKLDSVVKQTNEAFRKISNEDRTKIIKDDSGTPRLLLGYQQDGFTSGSVGLKVSKEGYDVEQATSSQLVFNSDQNVFKIVQTGNTTSPEVPTKSASAGTWSVATGNTTVVPHNLGFIPVPMAFINLSGLYLPMPYTATMGTSTSSSSWYTITYSIASDATNLYIDTWASVFGTSVSVAAAPVKYYLLQETAN